MTRRERRLPGLFLRRCARLLYSPRTFERVIDPLIADLQYEHGAALASSARLRAVWVRLRGYVAFWEGLLIHTALFSWRLPVEADVRADRRCRRGLGLWTAAALGLTLATLILDNPTIWRVAPAGIRPLLLPSMVLTALPFSLLLGTTLALRGGSRRADTRFELRLALRSVLLLALTVCVAAVIGSGWILPASNQRFRQRMYEHLVSGDRPTAPLNRGTRELTLPALQREIAALEQKGDAAAAVRYRVESHVRLALPAGCLVLALFGTAAMQYGSRTRARSAVRCVVVWLAVGNGYHRLLMMASHASNERVLPPFVGPWLANVVFGILAAALLAFAARRLPETSPPPVASA